MTVVAPQLVGREQELARIEALLANAQAGESGALVVRGEAGIGKTVLLEAAVAMGVGMRVLRARGVESESGLPFAALVELVHPVDGMIDRLPAQLAAVLHSALGRGPTVPVAPLQLGVAVLALLSTVADQRPVLVVVDDAHWIDGASAAALLFAARRLGAEGVAMLFAVREGEPQVPDTSGLDELALSGLDRDAAEALLSDIELSGDVLARFYAAMRGNPLALLEGGTAVERRPTCRALPVAEVLRPGRRIELAFSRRLAALGHDAQRALVVVSAAKAPSAVACRAQSSAHRTDPGDATFDARCSAEGPSML